MYNFIIRFKDGEEIMLQSIEKIERVSKDSWAIYTSSRRKYISDEDKVKLDEFFIAKRLLIEW